MHSPVSSFRTYLMIMIPVIAVHVIVIGLKGYAYLKTGSQAILSDALEGIINVLASCFALLSLWLSEKPPDKSHPYGHGKIEYFSVGFEGALIFCASLLILRQSVPRLFDPQSLKEPAVGMWVLTGSMLVQSCAVVGLFAVARKTGSAVLRAEGHHILSDIFTTAAVLVGFSVASALKKPIWDAVVATGVACFILITGFRLVGHAFSGLMDETDRSLVEYIAELLKEHRKEWWIDVHRLRLRKVGNRVFVDLHLILPRNFHLWQAHMEALTVEKLLKDNVPYPVDVVIHLDPCKSPDCRICRKYDCEFRMEPQRASVYWDGNTIMSDSEPERVEEA
ncbi:cation diffusion facilitator family transporter [Thermodesulforhabdus norvegica]|uniref:Cation diffusion facilitator family transporter n=1 Tax=Thermodesulforhabdus norvegica TaxID=39841 RepID=A0A1I4W602_9BACT|nr:cation diffusion facilitator family transporter [Thermodesulforhabdus norvegica]SFN09058.1 cation diffusion facilitator family transporter [Thermodesulforhabdus norvegica]